MTEESGTISTKSETYGSLAGSKRSNLTTSVVGGEPSQPHRAAEELKSQQRRRSGRLHTLADALQRRHHHPAEVPTGWQDRSEGVVGWA